MEGAKITSVHYISFSPGKFLLFHYDLAHRNVILALLNAIGEHTRQIKEFQETKYEITRYSIVYVERPTGFNSKIKSLTLRFCNKTKL